MYHSTIPQRSRPITADDFKEAAHQGLSAHSCEKGVEQLATWNQHVAVKPQDLLRMIASMNLSNLNVEMDFLDKTLRFKVSDQGKAIQALSFGFDLDQEKRKSLVNATTRLHEQRRGLGTRTIKTQIALSMALGVPSFDFAAGLENGGYSWARKGFEINTAYYADKSTSLYYLGKAIRGRLSLVKEYLPETLYETCHDLSSLNNADDITHLAHQNQELVLKEDDFDLRNMYRHSILAQAFAQAGLTGDDGEDRGMGAELQKMQLLIRESVAADQPVLLGQFLLYGSEWNARLDFANERQMKKVEAHAGPFQFLKPACVEPTRSSYRMAPGFAL